MKSQTPIAAQTLNQFFHAQETPYHRCLEAMFECASACWISADALLGEANHQELRETIHHCLEVAEACTRTAKMLVLETPQSKIQESMNDCAEVLSTYLANCERLLGEHEHLEICHRCCVRGLRCCQETLQELIAA